MIQEIPSTSHKSLVFYSFSLKNSPFALTHVFSLFFLMFSLQQLSQIFSQFQNGQKLPFLSPSTSFKPLPFPFPRPKPFPHSSSCPSLPSPLPYSPPCWFCTSEWVRGGMGDWPTQTALNAVCRPRWRGVRLFKESRASPKRRTAPHRLASIKIGPNWAQAGPDGPERALGLF